MPHAVVVGAGDCGTRAAIGIRDRGWDGDVTLIGSEPTPPYDRPALSKSFLTGELDSPKPISTTSDLIRNQIEFCSETIVTRIDREAKQISLIDGQELHYDRLLISTGARARQPPVSSSDLAVLTLRNRADAQLLRSRLEPGVRLCIIGGGFIGLEVASSASQIGCQVTIVEFAHQLMSRIVPPSVAAILKARHLKAGVDIRTGSTVASVVARRGALKVSLSDDSTLLVDVVASGVGAIPNTELAASAGLPIENGVRVDEQLASPDRSIFAAGDCASFPHPLYFGKRLRLEAWRNALEHAAIAAENMVGGNAVSDRVPWFWSDQFELGMQIAGLHSFAAFDVTRTREDGVEMKFGLDPSGRIVSASGVAEGTTIGRDISVAEALIGRRAEPNPALLANPTVPLTDFLV